MSSSITIPARRPSTRAYSRATKAAASSEGSSYSSTLPSISSASSSPSSMSDKARSGGRRPSLLSSAFTQQESTVINIGDPEGPPRLISYLSSSQGFAWNPEIFLPSYIDCEYTPLENRRDPVHDILISDEETKEMLPQ